jgi:hypothetical protein
MQYLTLIFLTVILRITSPKGSRIKNFSSVSNCLVGLLPVSLGILLALSVVGCATGQAGSVVDHSFEFHASTDSPGIQVLAYSYGDSPNTYGGRLRATEEETKNGTVSQGTNITGPITVGKYLYVKWRIKKTGEVFEDTVDLQKQWPRSMADFKIYFIIEDRQLFVYLITELKERPYFTQEQGDEINSFNSRSPRQKSLRKYARSYITLIYPEYQRDPHLPPELRRR